MSLPSSQGPSAIERGYVRLAACRDDGARVRATTVLILAIFDDFYSLFCEYPYRAKRAFVLRDPHASVQISRERLGLYSRYIAEHGPRLVGAFPALESESSLWEPIDRLFVAMIVDRYEADTAFSFAHSLRRNICQEVWRPVACSFPPPSKLRAFSMASVHRRLAVGGRLDAALITSFLSIPEFSVPWRSLESDAQRILERVMPLLHDPQSAPPVALDVIEAGFFRDRRAFVVGRWVREDDSILPFVVAVQNGAEGIYAEAVVHRVPDIHGLFSSALANLHVTTRLYYQTCVFLYSLMPRRPLGHHYSTIGYNHVGKVAILNEIVEQMRASGQRFKRSPGAPGTVAVGFTFDACEYHLKVIRDQPTESYKWGHYPGAPGVIEKAPLGHGINRAGSMLDNVMYFNLRLDRAMFEPDLLEELCADSSNSVHVDEDGVLLRSLIVELKIIPLSVYLRDAAESETREVIGRLGRCIRNNAAANIFNKDLDSRNYGVGRYGNVFLFDYDAVEKLTDVKIRTNLDREPGEEAVPDWFFEDGVVFLPEELQHGMQLMNRHARKGFREENEDLLTVEYWERIQQRLLRGEIPELQMFPDSCNLDERPAIEAGATARR